MTQLSTTMQFTSGTMYVQLTVDSANQPISNEIIDQLFSEVRGVVSDALTSVSSQISSTSKPDGERSKAKQTVTFEQNGITLTVKGSLTAYTLGIDSELQLYLGFMFTPLCSLHKLLEGLIKKEKERAKHVNFLEEIGKEILGKFHDRNIGDFKLFDIPLPETFNFKDSLLSDPYASQGMPFAAAGRRTQR